MNLTPFSLACAAALLLVACSPPPTYEDAPDIAAAPPLAEAAPALDAHSDTDDHDEDVHAGGEAHMHGVAELAVVLEANFVTVSVDAPLANFGLSENTRKKAADLEEYAEGLTELMGDARCDLVERSADIRRTGDHAAMTLSIVWDCRRPSRLDGLMFTGFEIYSGFETVHAVYIGGDKQSADVLTPDNPFLPF